VNVDPGNCQISVRNVLTLVLAPVVRLAASIVAEPLVAPALSAFRIRPGKGDYAAAILAARSVATGGHQPPHLKVHGSKKVIKVPTALNSREERLATFGKNQYRIAEFCDHSTYPTHSEKHSDVKIGNGLFSKVLKDPRVFELIGMLMNKRQSFLCITV
jgi:hypothetical protein